LITGSGFLDMATRLLLKQIYVYSKLVIYAFIHPDPYGIEMLLVYTFGFINIGMVPINGYF